MEKNETKVEGMIDPMVFASEEDAKKNEQRWKDIYLQHPDFADAVMKLLDKGVWGETVLDNIIVSILNGCKRDKKGYELCDYYVQPNNKLLWYIAAEDSEILDKMSEYMEGIMENIPTI